jgi:hypothetical protein
MRCSRCHAAHGVLVLLRGDTRGTGRIVMQLCEDCLAEATEIASGLPIVNQLKHWKSFGLQVREWMEGRPRSRKAEAKALAREAERRGRMERVF